MTAYYNEHDLFAAAWLRELIEDGLIAPGEVDERSIEDVVPTDLAGFVQCHFFAGIGIWSLALRQAGWPDSAPIWTGSCPCQPFSAAGKGGGFDDERHLWPAFHWLIEQCGPQLVLGEQVASKDGLAWLDLVSADVEASGYAFGAADTCAAGFGAPHIRQRLYWMADAASGGRQSQPIERPASLQRSGEQRQQPQDGGSGGVGNALCPERWPNAEGRSDERNGPDAGRQEAAGGQFLARQDVRPGPLNGLWARPDWLLCTDERWRPVEPSSQPMVDAGAIRRAVDAGGHACEEEGQTIIRHFPLAPSGRFPNRVGLLRGAGNAINLAQATGFISAVMEVRQCSNVRAAA